MTSTVEWIDIQKIRVSDRVRRNYSHLNDFIGILRGKRELEVPILVAGDMCRGARCSWYARKGTGRRCINDHYSKGFCLKKPVLLDGATRLEAARRSGWKQINCCVVEPKNETWMKEVEIITNTLRKQFDLWEQVQAGLMLEQTESKRAVQRSRAGKVLPSKECGRVRDLVALKAGFKSANSYIAAKQVYLQAHTSIRELVEQGFLKLTPASKLALLPFGMQEDIARIAQLLHKHKLSAGRLMGFLSRTVTVSHREAVKEIIGKLEAMPSPGQKDVDTLIRSAVCTNNPTEPAAPAQHDIDSQQISDTTYIKLLENHMYLLLDCMIEQRNIKADEKQTAHELDRLLRHSEKLSRNIRSELRIASNAFDDTFTDQVRTYRSMLIESIQFFAQKCRSISAQIDDCLLEELHRTFHNSILILHNAAAAIARALR